MGGGGRGSDIAWVGSGKGPLRAFLARRRARRQMKSAVEADLAERGIPVPSRALIQTLLFWVIVLVGLVLSSMIAIAIRKSL